MSQSPTGDDLHEAQPSAVNPEDGEALFSGVVFVSEKEKHLLLTSNGVCLGSSSKNKSKGKEEDLLLLWSDVIWADSELPESEESEQPESAFSIHYIHQQSDRCLHHKCLTVVVEDGDVGRWVSIFQEECLRVVGRPKKLYIVINPVSGGGKARHIHDRILDPLFKMSQIETTVKVTEKAKHAMELVEQENFTGYDGIISVGGDGLYQEILQGLIIKHQKEAGVNYNDTTAKFVKPIIPIGVIPAGSCNRMNGWLNNGVIDIETAALHVIRGEQHFGQALIVYSGNKFLYVGGQNCAYGLFGDVILKGEELSWMGKARLMFATLSVLLKKRRMFKVEIEYQKVQTIDKNQEDKTAEDMPNSDSTVYDSKDKDYCGIHAFAVEMKDVGERCVLNPFGKCFNLFLDRGCSTMGFFRHIMMITNGKKPSSPIANLDVIENITSFHMKVLRDEHETDENVSGGRAKARQLEHIINIDGEAVHLSIPQIEVRVKINPRCVEFVVTALARCQFPQKSEYVCLRGGEQPVHTKWFRFGKCIHMQFKSWDLTKVTTT